MIRQQALHVCVVRENDISIHGWSGVIYFFRYNFDFKKLSKNAWLATYAGTRTNYIGLMVGS